MPDELALDKRLVRRSFDQAAKTYDAAAVLQNEVCGRMLSRLEYIKLSPQTVLDAGSGTGNALPALSSRFAEARLVALDIAPAMLGVARKRFPWWHTIVGRKSVSAVCGDVEALPLASESVDLVWSNLALQWVSALPVAFAEMHRALRPGGLLMFSSFGPDTLKELRDATTGADSYTHVNRFVDMHDIGDMLVESRFADPVIDMEMLTLTYDRVRDLMHDLKAIGAHNVTRGRRAALGGRRALERVEARYETHRREGKLPATFEVVYGHAWKPQPRTGPSGPAEAAPRSGS